MFESPFTPDGPKVPIDSEYIFVSDMFVSDYVGGAELTSQALIDSCPRKIGCVKSTDVNEKFISEHQEKYWIFGNFSSMRPDLIPLIYSSLNYSILEYDYKFCKYRSPEKHFAIENKECDCLEKEWGQLIANFYSNSDQVWFMSERQLDRYSKILGDKTVEKCTVLSSVFDDKFFATVKSLRQKNADKEKKGWIVLGSSSWIKGAEDAEKWCIKNKKDFRVIWGLPYQEVLEQLSLAEGFVYLPKGGDTCPRMVIEAKLLGCKLEINENVEHAKEIWFDTDDMFDTEAYLYAARERFWSATLAYSKHKPTVSGYTTTLNCIEQRYPWKQSIESMLRFSDEVVVVDGGSTDGTWEQLVLMSKESDKLKIYQIKRDWESKRFAVFDGAQKAEARKRCTSEFLWQQDADEVVHELDGEKITALCKNFPRGCVLVSLPVIEYWGSVDKVRCDINPWKWRLSKNLKNITHGIPAALRRTDADGNTYAMPGTDGCDYIFEDTGEVVPHASFYTEEVHNAKIAAISGNDLALNQYEAWFNQVVESLPGVHHYSWIDIERKIKTYKNYWQKHWESLFDIKQEDNSQNNKFFDKPWKEVSEEEIKSLALKLSTEMGGWIFHEKIDFSKNVPHIKVRKNQPKIMM